MSWLKKYYLIGLMMVYLAVVIGYVISPQTTAHETYDPVPDFSTEKIIYVVDGVTYRVPANHIDFTVTNSRQTDRTKHHHNNEFTFYVHLPELNGMTKDLAGRLASASNAVYFDAQREYWLSGVTATIGRSISPPELNPSDPEIYQNTMIWDKKTGVMLSKPSTWAVFKRHGLECAAWAGKEGIRESLVSSNLLVSGMQCIGRLPNQSYIFYECLYTLVKRCWAGSYFDRNGYRLSYILPYEQLSNWQQIDAALIQKIETWKQP